MVQNRRVRCGGRRTLATSRRIWGHPGLFAIHLRFDGTSQRRDGESRELTLLQRRPSFNLGVQPRERQRHLAPGFPRFRFNLRDFTADLSGDSLLCHGTCGVFTASGALVASHLSLSRNSHRRPQLRLRTLRSEDRGRRAIATRSQVLENGDERGRTRASDDVGEVFRGVWRLWLRRQRPLSRLRFGRSDAESHGDRQIRKSRFADGGRRRTLARSCRSLQPQHHRQSHLSLLRSPSSRD